MSELAKNIFYAGVKAPEQIFDIMIKSEHGTTYNSYIVRGDKTALIDGVHEKFSAEFIKNIEEVLPAESVDYIICNHTEPNHSGSIKKLLEINPDITVIGTIAAVKNLKEITNTTFNERIAKDGEILDLGGGKALKFLITPNLNWPDTMMTYELDEKVLFSCDVFAAHYCENAICDCDIVHSDRYEKAFESYYDGIIKPFGGFAAKVLEKISNLDINLICTGHGPVIKKNVDAAIRKYHEWLKEDICEKKTLAVFYASAYGYTHEMADVIAQAAWEKNLNVNLFDIQSSDKNETVKALNGADALAFGSPTINRNAAKPVWDLISQLDVVSQRGIPCFVFGSYGWSGEALYYLHSHLRTLHLKPFEKPFGSVFKPSDENKLQLREYTLRFIDGI